MEDPNPKITRSPTDYTFEKHYKIAELAEMWQMGVETVRRMVDAEPDVPRVGRSPRIPEPIARRIHTKMMTPKQRLPRQRKRRTTIGQTGQSSGASAESRRKVLKALTDSTEVNTTD